MSSLQQLLDQKAEIERRIAETRSTERTQALETIRKLMSDAGLTVQDLVATGEGKRKISAAGKSLGKVAAKYRNPSTGDAWSGRGLKPRWLRAELDAGRKLEEFAV